MDRAHQGVYAVKFERVIISSFLTMDLNVEAEPSC